MSRFDSRSVGGMADQNETPEMKKSPAQDQSKSAIWMTDELRSALSAIPGPHERKKRNTVILLAFARANNQSVKDVFNQPSTCNETIWYTKWKFDPAIDAAFQACYARALAWADDETARVESHYRRIRKQKIAELAAEAPNALHSVMTDKEQGGGVRIKAANDLMRWADPDLSAKIPGGDTTEVNVNMTPKDLSDDELARIAAADVSRNAARGSGGTADTPAGAEKSD